MPRPLPSAQHRCVFKAVLRTLALLASFAAVCLDSSFLLAQETLRSRLYNGNSVYTPPQQRGLFGYQKTEKREPVRPSGKIPDAEPIPEVLVYNGGLDIPLTSSTGNTAGNLPQAPMTGYASVPPDTAVNPLLPQPTGFDSVSTEDRLNSFSLMPYPERESLCQGLGVDMWYLPNRGQDQGRMYHIDAGITGAFPMPSREAPLLLTPLFDWTQYSLPKNLCPQLEDTLNLYSPGLRAEYLRPINDNLLLDLAVTLRWSSDFQSANSHAFRITGYGSVLWKMTNESRLVLGVSYNDLASLNVLPIAGFLWKPNDSFYLEALFPRPKIAWRLPDKCCRTDVPYWFYVAGEYEGNRWMIQSDARNELGRRIDYQMTYYDLRCVVGLERRSLDEWNWAVEGGLAFGRHLELESRDELAAFHTKDSPKPAGLVRLKVMY